MKIIFIFDQIQAGLGGKENGDVELGGKRLGIGSTNMFENLLKESNSEIIATLYSGDDYFLRNHEIVSKKMAAMVRKLQPDVVICGPAFNYEKYGQMCGEVGLKIEQKVHIPVVAAMSKECVEAISEYKDKLDIIKMPKKGGTGLTASLKNIIGLADKKVKKEDYTEFKKEYCY